jgi:hypothetical protein
VFATIRQLVKYPEVMPPPKPELPEAVLPMTRQLMKVPLAPPPPLPEEEFPTMTQLETMEELDWQ